MKNQRIKEVIVVEGRYDRNMLLQVVDATVVETGGFSVFNDREKLNFLRRLAEKRGLILHFDHIADPCARLIQRSVHIGFP